MKYLRSIAVLIVLVVSTFSTDAQTVMSLQAGVWAASSTWSTGNIPQANQSVVIQHAITCNTSWPIHVMRSITITPTGSLTLGAGSYLVVGTKGIGRYMKVDGALTITGGGVLQIGGAPIQVNGTVTVNSQFGGIDGSASDFTIESGGELEFLDGDLYCNNFALSSGAYLRAAGPLSGVIDVTGGATLSGDVVATATGSFPSTKVMSIGGSMNVSGMLSVGASSIGGNYTAYSGVSLLSGSDVYYCATGNQTIDASQSYYSLTLGGSGDKSLSALLTVQDAFTIGGSARFSNTSSTVICGSSLINNSSTAAPHTFGSGTYTFTGTTIGGSSATDFNGSTVSFSGASIIIGDGNEGDGNLSFSNVNFTNTNCDLRIGANSYSGTVSFGGALSLSGDNASVTVSSGTVNLANTTVSGDNSTILLEGGSTTITGNVICGNNLTVAAPATLTGNLSVAGDLTVSEQLDVSGTLDVTETLLINSSGAGTNVFGGLVTVDGALLRILGGANTFTSGLTHSSAAVGSNCTISGTYTVGATAPTIINAETVVLNGSPSFYTLSVSNPNGTFSSFVSFTIERTASFAKDLNMAGLTLTFPATAPVVTMLGAGEVIGNVKRTLQALGTYTFNAPYTTLQVPALVSPEEFEFKLTKSAPDAQAITRHYDIRRTNGTFTPSALLYTLGLQYKDSEMNGNNESTLMLAYGAIDVAGENQFTKLPTSLVNTVANIVVYHFDGVTTFNHRYTLADLTAPLPVELVSFSGRRKDAAIELRWKTATELNNFGFDIERSYSRDGQFENIGFVEGNGNKSTETSYFFADDTAPDTEVFYRLRQIDRDGEENYSPIVAVSAGELTFDMGNYPNPFNPSTTITFTAPVDGRAVLTVFNTLGEQINEAFNAEVLSGEMISVPFDAGDLPGGTYFYTLQVADQVKTGKMLLTK